MDYLLDLFGRDALLVFVVFVGSVIRAGKGERVPAIQGLLSAFAPFFVVMCLLYLLEWGVSLLGLELPAKPMIAFGGLFGWIPE
ncbi:hypothetical protein GO755_30345 [Spirosoma sp. HMF4905]|uniref:Uncharacterized protein n=1 Tax=Spirosoma arboris TaxID=2682092 RepID=A0A7K1SKN1_9BACT|nr:hypothetical protein [Spirosoma arboris]MVM34371.1 hypothetical protein [Spirosoma arboris]